MNVPVRILMVEDETGLGEGIHFNLIKNGYAVEWAKDGRAALETYRESQFDLILLDIMLPYIDGFEVARQIRTSSPQMPILMLTARTAVTDRVHGLEAGADDYITKPFSLRELLARVKAVLRRSADHNEAPLKQNSAIEIGKLTVDFSSFIATSKNKPVQMTHKEFELLHYLWENRNSVVSRDDLLNKIWGYDETPTTRTVDNFIVRLRQKIEKDPEKPHIIITVHGIGYKLLEY